MDIQSMAVVALGSNLGDSRRIILSAMDRLQQFSNRSILRSSLYSSAPVECPPGSPDFVNAVVGLSPLSGETPESLLLKLQALECEFGRKPKLVLNEARPLDLDLIAFGPATSSSPLVTLPHPRAHLRPFVLEPLAEITPGLILPSQTSNVEELLAQLGPNTGLRRLD